MNITVVGTGRAGSSFSRALTSVGHQVENLHHEDASFAQGDVVLLCVPDDHVGETARRLDGGRDALIVHVSGSLGLDVLSPHARVGSMHPLVPLVDERRGAERLVGAAYALSGDDEVASLARSLRGKIVTVDDPQRALYHASACVAANHLVALLAHVQRLSRDTGVEFSHFVDLARMALEDVTELGPVAALTGPAHRGDAATIARHRQAIPAEELAIYDAMCDAARGVAHDALASA